MSSELKTENLKLKTPRADLPLRAVGTCVSWIATRGFGFVSVPGETRSVFVHCHDVPARNGLKALKEGEPIELSYLELADKRLRAIAVFFNAECGTRSAELPTNAPAHSPSPGGPQPAERESINGQPSRGGLGKPLGRGEGGHSNH
jgi:cold shock CspA family protein